MPSDLPKKSFLYRAKPELQGATVEIEWGGDAQNPLSQALDNTSDASTVYPRARYLSQQFVDELCSSDGVDDKLLNEVERVIFEAHDVNQKDGAISFDELLDKRASAARVRRKREQENLENLAEQVGAEIDKIKLIPSLTAQIKEKEKFIAQYIADRGKLVCKEVKKKQKDSTNLAMQLKK